MIVSVRGVLESVGPDWVHLQMGGVTLQVFAPSSAVRELGPIGSQVQLFTHLHLRDDQPVLYGFPTAPALELFLILTSVTGVGPRLSLSLLSALGAAGLHQAIVAGDVVALTTAPGVGRRAASRIILELKGKLEGYQAGAAVVPAGDDAEVIAALTALGYSTNEARRAVSNLAQDPGLSLEDRVRSALQQFGG